ncbi:MAG: response regulator, partial [Fibrobacter sp.]|nr:response regulator [Fibrobacter sp.]
SNNDPYIIALIDMTMPWMSGLEFGKYIKEQHLSDTTKYILMAPIGSSTQHMTLHEHGFCAVIKKPIRPSSLFDTLISLVAGKSVSTPSDTNFSETNNAQPPDNIRILVAEDNEVNQMVILGLLQKMGYTADVVGTGREAIVALEAIPYDIVLMDVQMPEMDGIQATKEIRSNRSIVQNHQVPIIALTARAMGRDREICQNAGMDDYICKPINPEKLAAIMARWLKKIKDNSDQNQSNGHPQESDQNLTEAVFKKDYLLNNMLKDLTQTKLIINAFFNDAKKALSEISDALTENDRTKVQHHAHGIKGTAITIGADAVGAAAQNLEKNAFTEDPQIPKEMFKKLIEEFECLSKNDDFRYFTTP